MSATAGFCGSSPSDARTFGLLTGLDPPETPVTPHVYKEFGLPFFQLSDGNKATGVAGKWGEIKGAKAVAAVNFAAKGGSSTQKAKGKAILLDQSHEAGDPTQAPSGAGSGLWISIISGVWEKLGGDSVGAHKDPSFDFPLVLMDVDDSFPKFKSVVVEGDSGENDEDGRDGNGDWAEEAGFYPFSEE